MQSDPLRRLADRLGIDPESTEFHRVQAHLEAEGWLDKGAADNFAAFVAAGAGHLKVIRQFPDVSAEARKPSSGRPSRSPSWRRLTALLELRSADEARHDVEVLAFRRDVLGNQLVVDAEKGYPTRTAVHAWLKARQDTPDAVGSPDVERLFGLAQALAETHGWTVDDAMVFALTDATPPKPVIRTGVTLTMGDGTPPRITVTAESWVPPNAVADVFRSVRDRMNTGTNHVSRRRVPALSARSSAFVSFVERTSGSWEARRKAWNAANPPSAQFKDRSNFRRTYRSTRRRLNEINDVRPAYLGA